MTANYDNPTTTPPKAPTPKPQTRWVITVASAGPGAPTVCRVRRALKWLLRTHGLRCLAVSEVPNVQATGNGGALVGNVAGGEAGSNEDA